MAIGGRAGAPEGWDRQARIPPPGHIILTATWRLNRRRWPQRGILRLDALRLGVRRPRLSGDLQGGPAWGEGSGEVAGAGPLLTRALPKTCKSFCKSFSFHCIAVGYHRVSNMGRSHA